MSGGDKEKVDKPKLNNQTKHVPKDAQVVMSILKELNVQEYEPRVINQLLEFIYRYVTCVLDDAKAYANHARKKTIDLDDVKLATETVLDKAFTCPPPRHALAKLAEVRNAVPLPPTKPHCGLRLPPDRYCLSACNYKLRAAIPPKKMGKSVLDGRSLIKTQLKSGGTGSGGKRQTVLASQTQLVTIPKPVIKFTAAKTIPVDVKPGQVNINEIPNIKMEVDMDTVNIPIVTGSIKRAREEDDFEIVQ